MNKTITVNDSFLKTLSATTQADFRKEGVVDDRGLFSYDRQCLSEKISDKDDLREIKRFLGENVSSYWPAVLLNEMPMGLDGMARSCAFSNPGEIHHVSSYTPRRTLDTIDDQICDLAVNVDVSDILPSSQSYGSCAAHACAAHLCVRGQDVPTKDNVPSARFVYSKSRAVGKYEHNQGRSYTDILTTVLEHGYLVEKEKPTGHDEFDDTEEYSDSENLRAKKRMCYGAVWLENNETRINAALDSTSGVFEKNFSVMIALKVHENWGRCYHSGIIRRHTRNERLLGGHAVLLIGFVKISGVVFAVILNSWGKGFGRDSPLGVPGIALISVGYLKEIMYHGALYIARDKEEMAMLKRSLNIDSPDNNEQPSGWRILDDVWKQPKERVACLLGEIRSTLQRRRLDFSMDNIYCWLLVGCLLFVLPYGLRQYFAMVLGAFAIVYWIRKHWDKQVDRYGEQAEADLCHFYRSLAPPVIQKLVKPGRTTPSHPGPIVTFLAAGLLVSAGYQHLPATIGLLLVVAGLSWVLRANGIGMKAKAIVSLVAGALIGLLLYCPAPLGARFLTNLLAISLLAKLLLPRQSESPSQMQVRAGGLQTLWSKTLVITAAIGGAFISLISI